MAQENKKLKIVGISGSLRKGSYNTALLRAAMKLVPADMEIEMLGIGDLPLFNQDDEQNLPLVVVDRSIIIRPSEFSRTPSTGRRGRMARTALKESRVS